MARLCLDDEFLPVRIAAARSLGRMGPTASAALPPLRAALAAPANAQALTEVELAQVDLCTIERTLGQVRAVRSVAEVNSQTIREIEATE